MEDEEEITDEDLLELENESDPIDEDDDSADEIIRDKLNEF